MIPDEEALMCVYCLYSVLARGLIDRSERGEVMSGGGTYRERCVSGVDRFDRVAAQSGNR
jgi:hypothetical protein